MTGTDGNPWCLLNINAPFGPPQNGYGYGKYQACGALQWELLRKGFNLGTSRDDGIWGPHTQAALQIYLNRVVDGRWDADDVIALQNRCTDAGFPCNPDGSFGPKTATAVDLTLNSTRF